MYELTVEDWTRFESEIEKLVPKLPTWSLPYAFRGQARAWPLISKLGRLVPRGMTDKRVLDVEKQAREAFAAKTRLYSQGVPLPDTTDDDDKWWPIMQHFGVPTRLLDWTKSIYVAAYFAVQLVKPEHLEEEPNGEVWFVDYKALCFNANLESGASKEHIRFLEIYSMADRMAAQQGMFSVSSTPTANHAEAISSILTQQDPDTKSFGKITIPGTQKLEFAQRLHMMNIDGASLFPGMDGLGRSISEKLTQQMAFEHNERILGGAKITLGQVSASATGFLGESSS